MGQMALNELEEYRNFKEELKTKLDETSENFIVIGYILKQVRDRRLYLNDAYSDINGFGMGTYGLSKATVSRFININTKFSVGGNSREIKPEYKGYGRSKIQEMLNVDESDMELITVGTTVGQIQELKRAEKEQRQLEKEEQQKNIPLMKLAAAEDAESEPKDMPEPFDAVMAAFWKENGELYNKAVAGILTPGILADEISPSGSRTYRNGVNMMFFYDFDKGIKLRSYAGGKSEITSYTYRELLEKTRRMNIEPVGDSKKDTEKTPESNIEQDSNREPVATPQPDTAGQPVPYIPMPGQTSVLDLPDVVSKDDETPSGGDIKTVIDGECRELDKKQEDAKECPYARIEIAHAVNYFKAEYSRMELSGQNTAKRRNYKMAYECIEKCFGKEGAD